MFTGIVREVGLVAAVSGGDGGARLEIDAPGAAALTAIGDSVSISGCCLTAISVDGSTLAFEAVPETLAKTSLGQLSPGDRVNIEPALRAGDPLGGHYVQGHVDGLGTVTTVTPEGEGKRITIEPPPELLRYVAEKGSITVDGVSLTVAAANADSFEIALIPHTLEATTLGSLAPGRRVNLETDVLAKYVERLLPS